VPFETRDLLPQSVDVPRRKLVDVEWRQAVIARHYNDVDHEEARVIADALRSDLDGDDLSKFEATQRAVDRTDLARSYVSDIFRTERTSIKHIESVVETEQGFECPLPF